MSPDEIAATYEVLAPMSTDYANANLERAGQAQASYGPLAQAAMGASQTAGIGNYTYNRLVRPAVDTMRDQLIVEGYSAALNKQISDSLRQAQGNYNRASRRYARSGGSTGGTGKPGWSGDIDQKNSDKKEIIYNSYTLTYPDGSTKTFQRPLSATDAEWYETIQRAKEGANKEGNKFNMQSNSIWDMIIGNR